MKKILIGSLSVLALLSLISCGGSSSTPPLPPSDTIAITGTLSSGSVSAQIIKDTSTPASGLTVVAVNNDTNAIYSATTSSVCSAS